MSPIPLWREIGIWLINLALWGVAYQGQRDIVQRPSQYKDLRIQAPEWIVLLCGKPSPDNRVEVGRMVMQLSALVMSVLWIPLVLLKIGFQARMGIFLICFLSNLVIGTLVTVIASLFRQN